MSLAEGDLEKEKRRLQNILATGQEETQPSLSHTRPANKMEDSERDRFQEGKPSSTRHTVFMNIFNLVQIQSGLIWKFLDFLNC